MTDLIHAVFLRILEYFGGILLLTTNRPSSYNHAFKFRVHLTLHYLPVDLKGYVRIWRTSSISLEARADPLLLEEALSELAKTPLNGRQIKNVVHVVSSLVVERDVQLN